MASQQGASAEPQSPPTVPDGELLQAIAGARRDTAVDRRSGGLGITERDSDGVRVLEVAGELELATVVELCARVDAAREAGQEGLLVDLTRLEFCDSSGVRALIGAAEEVLASAGRVVIVPPVEGAAARLFALIGAGELLPLRSTAAQALAALKPTPG